ncbi:proline--tRNA ligase [Caminibacter mediatlanticus]|uniref:Proline--tRNA ligase n=1 Tax=Caminibacter mediatlanticus TB-2 TaxID=391592 RepID=A0AAI9AIK7_9BACT|nr:proline--tRNA ligase [Caminibacter mediatlanticus]EDM24286.1 prolyl-tRNA synthetase [Caminibacter mediatlanticus TB-2]
MRFSRLFCYTLKEAPKDAVTPSHIYLIRGGYIKQVAAGIYDFAPLGKIVLDNIRDIIKKEMDNSGAQEVMLSFITPYELWEETGRAKKYGDELLRIEDRKGNKFVLSPTNEESIVDLVRSYVKSYKQLPINLYQINLKFRDEARPRFGLLRGREFIMKDAYSFHKDEEDLDREFNLMEETYKKIFSKMGLDFRVVEADSGAIGGSGSKEFMVLANTGEDDIVVCSECNYAANIEVAKRKTIKKENPIKTETIEEVYTPNKKTIEEVCEFLGIDPYFSIKAVVKKAIFDDKEEIVVFFVRGTDTLEETKAKNAIGAIDLADASEEEIKKAGLVPGFIGPFGIPSNIKYVIDDDLRMAEELVCGANKKDYHIKGAGLLDANLLGNLTIYRDIAAVKEGDLCPKCGKPLKITKGIEVGHIFKLGDVYSKPMNATFLDENGKAKPFIMGCYGIGVSRLIAAAIEQNHDDKGIIWPKEIAPFVVDIIIGDVKKENQVKFAENLYEKLKSENIKVLLDDRKERFGVKINDFELLGFPYAVIVGKKLKDGIVEIRDRRSDEKIEVKSDEVFDFLKEKLKKD